MFKTPKVDLNKFVVQMLPPTKRKRKFIAFFKGLISGFERINLIFKEFIYGTSKPYWGIGATYNIDDEVVYKYKVYKSLIDGNLGIAPDSDSNSWELILNSFIGVEESSRYCSQKLVLEWMLNRYFEKEIADNGFIGFVQPDDPITPTPSTIFIENVAPEYPSFLIGIDETESDSISTIGSSGYITLSEDFTSESSYIFSVNIPTTVYSSINSNSAIADSIIRAFLDQYIPESIFYIIIAY